MRNNEQGRSMIEMLGVLAIVGVLSVGGIAGYSKAMSKFKTNKVIDQINTIQTNVRTLFSSQKTYNGLDNALAKRAGLVPAEMYENASDSTIGNAFGGALNIAVNDAKTADDHKAYTIEITEVPTNACISIVTTDWGGDSGSGLLGMTVGGAATLNGIYVGAAATEDIHIAGSVEYPIPYDALQAATDCSETTSGTVTIAWKYL